MSEEKGNDELQLKVWEKTVDVQMHFNDLCLKVRSLAVSILGVLLGASAISYRFGGIVTLYDLEFHIAAVFIALSMMIWAAFYSMDRYWYHELLKGAVRHGREVEEALSKSSLIISLSESIRDASHNSLNKNAASKLNWFYMTVLLVQFSMFLVVFFGSLKIV